MVSSPFSPVVLLYTFAVLLHVGSAVVIPTSSASASTPDLPIASTSNTPAPPDGTVELSLVPPRCLVPSPVLPTCVDFRLPIWDPIRCRWSCGVSDPGPINCPEPFPPTHHCVPPQFPYWNSLLCRWSCRRTSGTVCTPGEKPNGQCVFGDWIFDFVQCRWKCPRVPTFTTRRPFPLPTIVPTRIISLLTTRGPFVIPTPTPRHKDPLDVGGHDDWITDPLRGDFKEDVKVDKAKADWGVGNGRQRVKRDGRVVNFNKDTNVKGKNHFALDGVPVEILDWHQAPDKLSDSLREKLTVPDHIIDINPVQPNGETPADPPPDFSHGCRNQIKPKCPLGNKLICGFDNQWQCQDICQDPAAECVPPKPEPEPVLGGGTTPIPTTTCLEHTKPTCLSGHELLCVGEIWVCKPTCENPLADTGECIEPDVFFGCEGQVKPVCEGFGNEPSCLDYRWNCPSFCDSGSVDCVEPGFGKKLIGG